MRPMYRRADNDVSLIDTPGVMSARSTGRPNSRSSITATVVDEPSRTARMSSSGMLRGSAIPDDVVRRERQPTERERRQRGGRRPPAAWDREHGRRRRAGGEEEQGALQTEPGNENEAGRDGSGHAEERVARVERARVATDGPPRRRSGDEERKRCAHCETRGDRRATRSRAGRARRRTPRACASRRGEVGGPRADRASSLRRRSGAPRTTPRSRGGCPPT
jgi:hypothetical protein